MSDGQATNGAATSATHTPSQRYLSTRGEDNDVRHAYPAQLTDPRLTLSLCAVLLRGCRPQGPRQRRRPVHPRADPRRHELAGLERPVLLRARLQHPVPVHLALRDPGRRPQGDHRPELRDLPARRGHAPAAPAGQPVPARAVPRPNLRLQGRRAAVPGEPVRVLPDEEE